MDSDWFMGRSDALETAAGEGEGSVLPQRSFGPPLADARPSR